MNFLALCVSLAGLLLIFFIGAIIVSSAIGLGCWLYFNIPLMLDKWTGFDEEKRKEAARIQETITHHSGRWL